MENEQRNALTDENKKEKCGVKFSLMLFWLALSVISIVVGVFISLIGINSIPTQALLPQSGLPGDLLLSSLRTYMKGILLILSGIAFLVVPVVVYWADRRFNSEKTSNTESSNIASTLEISPKQ